MRWTPRKGDWIFIAAAVAVVVFISLLPTPRERNPMVPATEAHRLLTSEKQCSQCHSPQTTRPFPDRHPKRQDCFKCHRRADAS